MTYPPDDHLLRDLAVTSWVEPDGRAGAEIPAASRTFDASGAVSIGALATAADVACARAAFPAAHPDWIATANLSISLREPVRHGSVLVTATPMPSEQDDLLGFEIDLAGAGTGAAVFVRIPRSASRVERELPQTGERTSMPQLLSPPSSVVQRLGLVVQGGAVSLATDEYVSNSFGAITGGALVYLVAAGAEEATGLIAADVMLRYIGQVRVGPARATTTVLRSGSDHAVCEVVVRDVGDQDRVLARANVTTVRRPSS